MIRAFYSLFIALFAFTFFAGVFWRPALLSLVVTLPLFALGVWDSLQTRHAVLRNFPLLGHFRYLLELIRPEINQYFIESNTDGRPFDRESRSLIYARSKHQLQTLPFGTQRDVEEPGYEWINHSMDACAPEGPTPRVLIGAKRCAQPYEAALLNISAMSFGSLSSAAIRALNGGAKRGGFYHNTGEGSVSPHHLEPGGDLVWQVGTGYFGCREKDGSFSRSAFAERAAHPSIKMIELKLSQGAKPGHGGILPAGKITEEIAAIRGVVLGHDVLSPPSHSAFTGPDGLIQFITELRELSGGKPVGFKLCVGSHEEFIEVCKSMRRLDQGPDFITVDGGEGGTGAAPLEFSDSVGSPLTDGLIFVHNALTGYGLREDVKLIASGKIVTGFQMARRLAIGADLCNSARAFMIAIGCIQARRCNANICPVGVATQNPALVRGLVVEDKAQRVANYQEETVDAFREILGAAGILHPAALSPAHLNRRLSRNEVKTFEEIYHFAKPGEWIS